MNNKSNSSSTVTPPLDQSSLVRLLQRINRERDELALMVVQQSSEAATIQAQADLIPQYRQGEYSDTCVYPYRQITILCLCLNHSLTRISNLI